MVVENEDEPEEFRLGVDFVISWIFKQEDSGVLLNVYRLDQYKELFTLSVDVSEEILKFMVRYSSFVAVTDDIVIETVYYD